MGFDMNLLLHPLLREGEGPRGYLLRLAEANGLSIRSLRELGISFNLQCLGLPSLDDDRIPLIEYVDRIEQIREVHPTVWNGLTPRYCPQCLVNAPYWHVGWELYWCDACPEHRTWLIDRCPECHDRLSWDRPTLLQCHCGALLSRAGAAECPKSVAELSGLLIAKVLGIDGSHSYSVLNELELQQLNKLIRLIGTYGDIGWQEKPQKIANADSLDVSWPITSLAAEILINGHAGLQGLLENIFRRYGISDDGGGRLRGRFGHFYTLLYRGFPEQPFDFLRREFESFIAAHWQGPLGRRNRNLPVSLLAHLSWIPARHACRQLGISPRRLQVLVDEGRIAGERLISAKGRVFKVVHRADVESMLALREAEIDLKSAMALLGLKKTRVAGMIQWLIPEAHRTGLDGCPWSIPRKSLDQLLEIVVQLPAVAQTSDGEIALSDVLRFWAWTDREIGKLLKGILEASLIANSRLKVSTGVSGLIFDEAMLRDWHSRNFGRSSSMSVPEVAEALQIKQEVAYTLVRQRFIETVKEEVGTRTVTRVWPRTVSKFKKHYVFGRDLASAVGTSPKALADRLDRLDIRPVLGPSVDGSRQYLYSAGDALNKALNQICGRAD